jgi:hypothetical protein
MTQRLNLTYPAFVSPTTGKQMFTATAAGLVFPGILVSDFQHITVNAYYSNTASYTFRFKASDADARPDFTAASTATNPWNYVQVVNDDTGSAVTGSTGVVISANGNGQFSVNTNNIKWLCIHIETYVSGTLDCQVFLSDNR